MKTARRACHRAAEPVVFLILLLVFFTPFIVKMGLANTMNTLMNTAYGLLTDTALYIMAIAVVTGALSKLLTAFGVVDLLHRLFSPLMRPLFDLPGAAALGVVTTYLSDNPAILTLTENPSFCGYFKKYQLPALTNLGTAFGMGLIVSTFMGGLSGAAGEPVGLAVLIGNLGAILGSVVSTRMMLRVTKKRFGADASAAAPAVAAGAGGAAGAADAAGNAGIAVDGAAGGASIAGNNAALGVTLAGAPAAGDAESASRGLRFLNALLDGGKSGVELGLGIIPGVLTICTLVLMLTYGMPAAGYTGAAYEGIGLLPYLAGKLDFLLKPLFGLASADGIAVPITALGSAGASLSIVPKLLAAGAANAHDIAVFTAMCMCWSGYLSTHASMMSCLGHRELIGQSILCHTVGGLCAGVAANWLYVAAGLLR